MDIARLNFSKVLTQELAMIWWYPNSLYNFEFTSLSSIILYVLVCSLFCFMTETWLGGVPQGSLFLHTLAHTRRQGWQGALTPAVTWQDRNLQTDSTVLWERRKGGSEANAFSVDQDLTLKIPWCRRSFGWHRVIEIVFGIIIRRKDEEKNVYFIISSVLAGGFVRLGRT